MKAKATATGYYGGILRYPGDVFDVSDGESALWFEPFETSEASQDPPDDDPPAPPDDDPLGIQALDTPPEEPQPEPPEEAPLEEPQPETDNKPRKTNKPA